jgi:hypothetical protein
VWNFLHVSILARRILWWLLHFSANMSTHDTEFGYTGIFRKTSPRLTFSWLHVSWFQYSKFLGGRSPQRTTLKHLVRRVLAKSNLPAEQPLVALYRLRYETPAKADTQANGIFTAGNELCSQTGMLQSFRIRIVWIDITGFWICK